MSKRKKHIVSFSGGKDSTCMLLMMLEKNIPVDKIIFVDTGKEFPEMYAHIEKVQKYINSYGLKIEKLSFDFDYYFSEHIKTKGKNKGTKGYGWPFFNMRWCTGEKKERIRRFIKQFNKDKIVNFQGIAYDERERAKRNKFIKYDVSYPLIDWQITEKEALEYCYSKGFDWGKIYEKLHRVSCYCCPLSRIGELKMVYRDYPKLWEEMMEMDKKTNDSFKYNYTLEELDKRFKKELKESK